MKKTTPSLKEPSIETLISEHIEKGRSLEDRVFQKPMIYGNDDFKELVSSWEESLKSFEKKYKGHFTMDQSRVIKFLKKKVDCLS